MRALPPGLNLELVRAAYDEDIQVEIEAEVAIRDVRPTYFDQLQDVLSGKPRWPIAVAASVATTIEELKRVKRFTTNLQSPSMTDAMERERCREYANDELFVEACRRIVLLAEPPFRGPNFAWPYPLSYLRVLAEDASPASLDVLLNEVNRATTTEPGLLAPLRRILDESAESDVLLPFRQGLRRPR